MSVYTCLIKFTVLTLFCSCPHVIDKCQAVSWKSSRIGGKYTATETSPKTLTLVYLTDIVTDQTKIYKTTSKERTRSEEGQQRKSFKKPLKTENKERGKSFSSTNPIT